MQNNVFKMQLLFFQIENGFAVGERSVFFALQILFEFGMLVAKRGQMIIMHILLLQSETRLSEPRSKSRIFARVLRTFIGPARLKTRFGSNAVFLTMTC